MTSTDTSTDSKSSTTPDASTAATTDHAATVAAMYDAFGRGDVTFILDQLRDDVVWEEGIRPTNLPWLRPGTGKQHVGQFFGALSTGLQFTTFQPLTIAQSGNEVVSVIREGAVALATGAVIPEDLNVHVWRFDDHGKVAWFRHIGDWHHQEVAQRANSA